MNKTPPNLDLIYDKVLDFNESQPDDYFDSVIQHLSENTPQVRNVFDNLIGVFSNNPSLLNALRITFLFIYRLGAPAFFSLESSKVLELQLDPSVNPTEILEIKRITKYCVEKFQKMQAAHEIPNIGHKYAELCNLLPEDPQIPDIQLTEFEKQYSDLSVKFQQQEQRLEVLIAENQENVGQFDTERIFQLLEQIDGLMIQPDLRFTKAENELILNFFHQRYALINRIQNEFPQLVQDYHLLKEEKRANILPEKGDEQQTENNQKQVQEVQNIKDFTFFIEGTSLAAFPESMTVEYKDYIYPFSNDLLKKKLKASICAFLNTNGGRILIGVRNTGFRVKGLFLTTNDQDNLIRDVDALLREFHPKVDPEEVSTSFIPIKKTDGTYKPGFYVVKILVRRGKPNELYFTAKDCYKRRNGQNESQMPANFKRDIIDRHAISIQTHPELFRDRAEFNDPMPELGIPVTNVKEQGPKDGKTPKLLGHKQKQQQQDKKPSSSSQQAALAQTTHALKFLVKNVPTNQPDIAQELKYRFDSISPYSKTLHFVKEDVILTFVKPEEARTFMEIVEKNPIIIGANTLDFVVKTAEKDKTEKAAERQEKFDKFRNKLEVDEEKKDPAKAKADASSIIWVRGIPDNTPDLKDKLTSLLGEFAQILKDMKIHNKKKRATLEFENSMQANEVLAFLTIQDRYIDETKVTFEKASPPSSPSHSKPSDHPPMKANNESHAHKPKESTKVNNNFKAQQQKNGETGPVQPPTSNILKVSNVPIEENSQEIGYFVKTCNHHIKKAIDVQYQRDHILFTFRSKEDAIKAFTFMVDNNFSFRGKKVKVEYQLPVKKSSGDGIHVPKGNQSLKKNDPMMPLNMNSEPNMQTSNSSTDYKSMLQAAGYGSVAVFEPQNFDNMNGLENMQSLQSPAFINSGSLPQDSNSLQMSGPQGIGLDYSNVTFNPGQKLQTSQQDELDHLIKANEALQTEMGIQQDMFNNALKIESSGNSSSINSNQIYDPNTLDPNFSLQNLQNHPLNLTSQKNQRPESMGPLQYPRENSVFGLPAPGRSSPSQEQQLKGPQPPVSQFPQNQESQDVRSQFGRPMKNGPNISLSQQGSGGLQQPQNFIPPQQFNPQFQQNQVQGQIQAQTQNNPPRLNVPMGSAPNLTTNPLQQQQQGVVETIQRPPTQMNYVGGGVIQPQPPLTVNPQQQFMGSQQNPPRIPTQPTGNQQVQGPLPNLIQPQNNGPLDSNVIKGSQANLNQQQYPPNQFNQPQFPPTQPVHNEKVQAGTVITQANQGYKEAYKGATPQQPPYQQGQTQTQGQGQGMYPPNQNYNPQYQPQGGFVTPQPDPNFPQQYPTQQPNNYYPPQFNQNQNQNQPPYGGNPQQYQQQYPGPQGQGQYQGPNTNYPPQNQGQWQGQQYPPQTQGQGQYPPQQGQGQGQYPYYPGGNVQKEQPVTQQPSTKSSTKNDKKQASTQGNQGQKQQGQNQNQGQYMGNYPPQQQDYGMPPYYQGYPQYPPQNQGGNPNYYGQNQGYNNQQQRGNAPYPMYNQQMQGDMQQRSGPQSYPNNQYGGYPNPQQKVGNN